MSKVIRKKDKVAVTSAEDKLMIAIKNLLQAYETEARNARKSK